MKNEEAIAYANDWLKDEYALCEDDKEVLRMAIEALKARNSSDSLLTEDDETCKEQKSKLDLISRQDAIRWVKTECNPYGKPTLEFESGKKVIEHLEKMPSADRPTGEWVDIDNYYRMATCSNCHKVTMFEKWGEYTRSYNYCPNCGADMRSKLRQTTDTDGYVYQSGLASAT